MQHLAAHGAQQHLPGPAMGTAAGAPRDGVSEQGDAPASPPVVGLRCRRAVAGRGLGDTVLNWSRPICRPRSQEDTPAVPGTLRPSRLPWPSPSPRDGAAADERLCPGRVPFLALRPRRGREGGCGGEQVTPQTFTRALRAAGALRAGRAPGGGGEAETGSAPAQREVGTAAPSPRRGRGQSEPRRASGQPETWGSARRVSLQGLQAGSWERPSCAPRAAVRGSAPGALFSTKRVKVYFPLDCSEKPPRAYAVPAPLGEWGGSGERGR